MNRGQQRGVVLVAVLFAVAIMSVMVVAVSALTRSSIAGEGLEQRRFATELALRSGLESAKALILTTLPAQRAYFDGAPQAIDLGQGLSAEITIRDAAGLADLNRTDLPLIEALLRTTLSGAEASELFARISGLRTDGADKARPADSAPAAPPSQDAAKLQDGTPREPAAAAPLVFLSVDQLKPLAKPQSAGQLGQWFTVFNPTGLVNPLAAPEDVLLAIPGFSKGDLAIIAQARKNRAPQPDQALQPMLERLKDILAVSPSPGVFIIGIRLNTAPGIIAQSTANAVVQIAQQGPLPFRTLAVSGL